MSSATLAPKRPRGRARLGALLRGSTRLDGLLRLLRRMGLDVELDAPLPVAPGVRAFVARGVVPLWLLEFTGTAGPGQIRASLPRERGPVGLIVALLHGPRAVAFGCQGADGEVRLAVMDRLKPRASDLRLLEELAEDEGTAVSRVVRWTAALDRAGIGARFFRDVRGQRDAIALGWTGIPRRARADREQLALLLLSRLLFLAFLQERGHLRADREFLSRTLREVRDTGGCVYSRCVRVLFFEVFNRRPGQRTPEALAFGALPYLNGGLFEPHALERRFPSLDLPDDVLLHACDTILQRYRFTTRDAAEAAADGEQDAGIDPEVLGRVFESLMAADRRLGSGSFYTPPDVVDDLVCRSLAALLAARCAIDVARAEELVRTGEPGAAGVATTLHELRVLDPACGSGAFLLGALTRITRLRAALESRPVSVIRHDIVARTLHGVDLLDDAAMLCSLRLWLALAPHAGEPVTPLPNLDRRIRQGDALIDPLDLVTPAASAAEHRGAALAPEVRRCLLALQPLGQAYVTAEPAERPALLEQLRDTEFALARAWLLALRHRLDHAARESAAAAAYRDLWGEPAPARSSYRSGDRLSGRLVETDALLTELEQKNTLPFFSFLVHFPADTGGFDLIVANPPWVRAHRWPDTIAGAVRERFRVCREAGWRTPLTGTHGATGAGQVDLSLLFLERALGLLAPDGALGMLLPAKLLRSLYAGGGRALLAENRITEIDDHSLDQHSVFEADAFTVAVVAQRRAPSPDDQVRITLRNRHREPLRFTTAQAELPLVAGDGNAPWLLAPPDVAAVFRTMQRDGAALGSRRNLRRGIITGANDVFVIPSAEHKLGGLSRIRAQGYFRTRRNGAAERAASFAGWIETSCLRPLLRGTDVRAWSWSTPQRLAWSPVNEAARCAVPPRMGRYLARHPAVPADGRLQRIHPDLLGAKVVWQDIADDLHAVAVPARTPGDAGVPVPVIPLNTVYYVCAADEREAMLLTALLNSLPVRTFARAIAERAKDARFRFFAWTVAVLPIPRRIPTALSRELVTIAGQAHEARGIESAAQARLDDLVARAYGLPERALQPLHEFDQWLRR